MKRNTPIRKGFFSNPVIQENVLILDTGLLHHPRLLEDYYDILEIPKNATSVQIRAAFKRLAMRYHPDVNGGDKNAEEKFKRINEAYHILSDPLKKSKYDYRHSDNYEEILAKAYYQRKGPFTGRTQRRPPPFARKYDTGKGYYKIQGLALAVFLIIAGFCFGVVRSIEYYVELQREELWRENTVLLNHVNLLFSHQKFNEAFDEINQMVKTRPLEFRIFMARDSLINALNAQAETNYNNKKFEISLKQYQAIQKYDQQKQDIAIRIAHCLFFMGNYTAAVENLVNILENNPKDVGVSFEIAMIYFEKLREYPKARHYFDISKALFKADMSKRYGEAFELVINPDDIPEIYYKLFIGRALTNMQLDAYEEALTDCNWSIFIRRKNPEGHYWRAKVKIQLGRLTGLCDDLINGKPFYPAEIMEIQNLYCQ